MALCKPPVQLVALTGLPTLQAADATISQESAFFLRHEPRRSWRATSTCAAMVHADLKSSPAQDVAPMVRAE
ncbi:MAG: hypothetical protein CVT82_15295 [Alphaproteobacteria bacterium HGW-Alphaproteobacteria-4]|nr:MAG: hypothetical protein CVT82_15295 [Alphaproteobacteria bacterium HGW-Alphaproteobacteria-4]